VNTLAGLASTLATRDNEARLHTMESQLGLGRWPGALLWASTVQFFIVERLVASAWTSPTYSWRDHAISDLGALVTGEFDGRLVGSPLHDGMNASLVVLGLTLALGAFFVLRDHRPGRIGLVMMVAAGVGAALVGFFPEDGIYEAHLVGQDLAFVLGNLGLIVLGFTGPFPRWLRWYGLASGVVGLVALVLFLSYLRFDLGLGGMERLVCYPLLVWLIVAGVTLVVTPWAVRRLSGGKKAL